MCEAMTLRDSSCQDQVGVFTSPLFISNARWPGRRFALTHSEDDFDHDYLLYATEKELGGI
jgi:hypothetical protein